MHRVHMGSFAHYDILGLSRNASSDEIKRAYKKQAMQHHPDKGGDPETFKKISNAYEVLSDPEKKSIYDQVGDEGYQAHMQGGGGGGGGFPFMDPMNIFEQFFRGGGGGGGGPERRRQIHHTLRVSMEEAFKGCQKQLKMSNDRPCPSCERECSQCNGRGSITEVRQMGFMSQMITSPCSRCRGSGKVSNGSGDCSRCKGRGKITDEETIQVSVPKGIFSGAQMLAHGNSFDIVLQIEVQGHPAFEREDMDLVMKVPLSMKDAFLGKEIKIPHFDGEFSWNTHEIGVVANGQVHRFPGKGFPDVHGGGRKGDLRVVFEVRGVQGKKFSAEQKKEIEALFKKLAI